MKQQLDNSSTSNCALRLPAERYQQYYENIPQ